MPRFKSVSIQGLNWFILSCSLFSTLKGMLWFRYEVLGLRRPLSPWCPRWDEAVWFRSPMWIKALLKLQNFFFNVSACEQCRHTFWYTGNSDRTFYFFLRFTTIIREFFTQPFQKRVTINWYHNSEYQTQAWANQIWMFRI
jgi:hypothetical protein